MNDDPHFNRCWFNKMPSMGSLLGQGWDEAKAPELQLKTTHFRISFHILKSVNVEFDLRKVSGDLKIMVSEESYSEATLDMIEYSM